MSLDYVTQRMEHVRLQHPNEETNTTLSTLELPHGIARLIRRPRSKYT